MTQVPAVIDLLAAQQREWRAQFPGLTNRAHQTIVGYLCTRGRAGVPVRQLYGVTKELFLLDDATVRERVEEIVRQGFGAASPDDGKLTGRTVVAPTAVLLDGFDAYLRAVALPLARLAGISPPATLTDRDRLAILQAFDLSTVAWLDAGDRFLASRAISPARRAEARRRLNTTSHWILVLQAIEHAHRVRAGTAEEPSLLADQLAAGILEQTGQGFQTIRDHISWLIAQGFLFRHPGRALRVSLADEAAAAFDAALVQAKMDMTEAVARWARPGGAASTMSGLAAGEDGADEVTTVVEQTIRLTAAQRDACGLRIVRPVHRLRIVAPPEADAEVLLSEQPVVIGRARPAQLLLPDGAVSRAHCQVALVDDAVQVIDLGSTNGTYVEGERIDRSAVLEPGMALRIGPYVLEYSRDDVAPV